VTREVPVDIGNTRIKFGMLDEADIPVEAASLPANDTATWTNQLIAWGFTRVRRWLVASVHPERLVQFSDWAATRNEPVSVVNDYRQVQLKVRVDAPERVGIDRLLNAVAAKELLPKGTPAVVVDVGTAVTIDLLDDFHVFVGGAILPGPRLMFESLHRQTAKLPLIETHAVPTQAAPGANTSDAMTLGVMAAQIGAAEYLVREYTRLCRNPPWLFLTGGALGALAEHPFPEIARIIADPFLTLQGIVLSAGHDDE
jgi:type III pantothenate kinase